MTKKASQFNLILSLFIFLAALIFIGTTAFMVIRLKDTQSEAKGKPSPVLTVAPSQVLVGESFTINGTGWGRNEVVSVGLAGYFDLKQVTTDGSGSFSLIHGPISIAGDYRATATTIRHNKVVSAETSFTVISN